MQRKLGPKGKVVIPKEICETLGLKEGASLLFELSGRAVVVRPEPSPEEAVEAFLRQPGPKLRRRVDLKASLDEEYKVPAGR